MYFCLKKRKCYYAKYYSLSEQKQKTISTTSELYNACCDGNLKKVENLLNTLSLDEINRIEQNGSTALHAACQYGYLDIVRALLERGASRRQVNNKNKTPQDEARNEKIKALFTRSPNATNERFVS
jgi:ankyrin repeat protein